MSPALAGGLPTTASPGKSLRVPFSLHCHQLLLSLTFFILAILTGYEVIIHCGFDLHLPMTGDVEHLFMYLLAICITSLEK